MNYVSIKNPGAEAAFSLPRDVLDLLQGSLQCVTAGAAKSGLRWEHKGIPTIFLEKIGIDTCDVYILPTSSDRNWRKENTLRRLLGEWGFPHLVANVRQPRTEHLRIVHVKWGDFIDLAPKLVEWVYVAQANQPFVPAIDPADQEEIDAVPASVPAERVSDTQLQQDLERAVRQSLQGDRQARAARLANAPKMPRRVEVTSLAFIRNPDVIAEVLSRAAGICERCRAPAPFTRRSDGSAYLEVHHKNRLADGGADTVENAIALCPNCHRRAHFA